MTPSRRATRSTLPSRSGFTLVELLVTMGIIALLASLIFPSLSKMRRAADQTQCVSNLRQVYSLCSQDIQDNEQQIPPAFNSLTTTVAGVPPNNGWIDYTWNQLTDTNRKSVISDRVFGCPAQRKEHNMAANGRTFSMNSILSNTFWNGVGRVPPIYYNKFTTPSKTLLFSDGAFDGTPYNSGVNGGNKMPEAVHDGYADIAFLDGHTERMKLADIPLAPTSLDIPATVGTPASIFWLGR